MRTPLEGETILTNSALIATGEGCIHKIEIHSFIPGATVVLYDNDAASGVKIIELSLTEPETFYLNIYFVNGLFVKIDGTAEITIRVS